MPIGVRVPCEDCTWSLTPVGIRVPVFGEDRTWSLTPVHVRVPGEGRMVAHARWCSIACLLEGLLLV